MNDCLFCKIINGEIPSYKIYEDAHTYAFLDISKDIEGHTLVVPKNHCTNIFDASEDNLLNIIRTTKLISDHYKSLGYDGVNILNNSGSAAEQSVGHLHIHITPRRSTDNFSVYAKLSSKEIDLEQLQKKLKLKS